MKSIVVIGGSFGGLTAAFELKRLLKDEARVTVISDDDKFVFIPSLPWLSLGWRTAKDIVLPLKTILEAKKITFTHAEVKGVDADSLKVITSNGEIPYDYLVIATGSALAFSEIPGFGPEGGYSECIFTLPYAERTNLAWRKFMENPGPIAIGSVQGVSCFGPQYEYAFEVDAELRRRKIRHKVPITFITSEPYAGHFGVGGFGASRRWIENEFARRDIKILENQAVEEFTPGEIKLKSGTKISHKLAVFAPAMKGVSAVSHLGNPRGFIPVDEHMRSKTHKNIFCAGVAVAIAPPEATPVPTGVSKTGYMSVRMALTAARTIANEIKNIKEPKAYEMNVQCIMDMGDTAAFIYAKPLLPPRQSLILKKAVWAKWMKISYEKYFMYKMKHGRSNWL